MNVKTFSKTACQFQSLSNTKENMRLSSILYWSGGSGGGIGTYGSVSRLPAVEAMLGMQVHHGHGTGMLRLPKF